eukprot:m.415623 g.415623  ORF g.415623 m.415623 type:complete len:1028 (+) comp56601_c0_seq2:151-3234(+)
MATMMPASVTSSGLVPGFRMTAQIIADRSFGRQDDIQCLDLSDANLISIEKLSSCPQLRSLIVRSNRIKNLGRLESCPELWNLDAGSNQIDHLDGFERFTAFGVLNLSANALTTFEELKKIEHIHIVSLSLIGNPIESDHNYRKRVIACLPKLWILDGEFITTEERREVERFMLIEAPNNERPKTARVFTATSKKNLQEQCVFGANTSKLLRKFPTGSTTNPAFNKSRLLYAAITIQEFINDSQTAQFDRIQASQIPLSASITLGDFLLKEGDLEKLLGIHVEARNMLYLLLACSMNYALPAGLILAVLDVTRLLHVSEVDVMKILKLPVVRRTQILELFKSVAALDQLQRLTTNLYESLHENLSLTTTWLSRVAASVEDSYTHAIEDVVTSRFGNLLAVELSHLVCLTPEMITWLQAPGVREVLSAATCDQEIDIKLEAIISSIKQQQFPTQDEASWAIYNAVNEHLLGTIQKKEPSYDGTVESLRKSSHASRRTSRVHSAMHSRATHAQAPLPAQGDTIFLSMSVPSRIISIQDNYALVQLDDSASSSARPQSGSPQSTSPRSAYEYVDLRTLAFVAPRQWKVGRRTPGNKVLSVSSPSSDQDDRPRLQFIQAFGAESNFLLAPSGFARVANDVLKEVAPDADEVWHPIGETEPAPPAAPAPSGSAEEAGSPRSPASRVQSARVQQTSRAPSATLRRMPSNHQLQQTSSSAQQAPISPVESRISIPSAVGIQPGELSADAELDALLESTTLSQPAEEVPPRELSQPPSDQGQGQEQAPAESIEAVTAANAPTSRSKSKNARFQEQQQAPITEEHSQVLVVAQQEPSQSHMTPRLRPLSPSKAPLNDVASDEVLIGLSVELASNPSLSRPISSAGRPRSARSRQGSDTRPTTVARSLEVKDHFPLPPQRPMSPSQSDFPAVTEASEPRRVTRAEIMQSFAPRISLDRPSIKLTPLKAPAADETRVRVLHGDLHAFTLGDFPRIQSDHATGSSRRRSSEPTLVGSARGVQGGLRLVGVLPPVKAKKK